MVDRQDILERLSNAKPHGSSFLKGAPLGIVVCADENITDVWVEDTSIATIFIQLAAHALGLGSCWIQIRKREHNKEISAESYIKEVLSLPDNFKVESMAAIGYPDEHKNPHSKDTLEMEKVFWNGFKR